ncbi:hypothetical protein BXZ70DRAFT_565895 [Cristinia sonorae]|uniref:Zinc finger Mcm10/DnaG-type domain-containing protein n=1 Tax=Cristinia sonorae TaxID=1940300 RepID=A0A8K0UFG2_9AGAR|nr:hypothetical protein BXZ70DRAFT_565895 [Cristinia sonorae]
MESTTSRKLNEEEKQAELRRQIAILQAQLKDAPSDLSKTQPPTKPYPTSPRRRKPEQNTLAPGTPSPKRRKLDDASSKPFGPHSHKPIPSLTSQLKPLVSSSKSRLPTISAGTADLPPKAGPSNVLSKLASLSKSQHEEKAEGPTRSSAFSTRPAPQPTRDEEVTVPGIPRRDERLALVEDLPLGPAEHNAPFDDPHFEYLEPNSGIRLLSRALPHDEFQDYLRGRYYLSPSKLYSVIRLLPNKQGYDVPVEGDWVTIAVVAERGQMKYSKAPVGVGRDNQEHLSEKDTKLDDIIPDTANSKTTDLRHWKGKTKQQQMTKPSGKKYINLKLIDFGCRSGSSASGGKSTIRGDAYLSLLLFESDLVEEIVGEDGKKEKIYRGGSKGAFERMSKLKEGAVVALLNPRILKPFQRSADTPHPTENILAVTPESIDSTVVIGQSRDLGMCKAVKRDGKTCGSWCDKRISDVCEWHIQHAVQAKRASRAEFSIGTSGLSSTAKRKPAYDPSRQWGLKPEPNRSQGDGATYVVSGHVISGSSDSRNLFVGETMGRDAQAKAARKAAAHDADRALQRLLKGDKEGMKTLVAAREFVKKPIGGRTKEERKGEDGGAGRKRKRREGSEDESSGSEDEGSIGGGDGPKKSMRKSAYSAQLIRNLGFDPTCKDGRKVADPNVQKKLEALAASHSTRKDIDLGPRPGKKLSAVSAPTMPPPKPPRDEVDLDSDDDLERQEIAAFGRNLGGHSRKDQLIDLDSSDVD